LECFHDGNLHRLRRGAIKQLLPFRRGGGSIGDDARAIFRF
jgi:hypothetical protein